MRTEGLRIVADAGRGIQGWAGGRAGALGLYRSQSARSYSLGGGSGEKAEAAVG